MFTNIFLTIAIVLCSYKKCSNILCYFDGNSPVIICSYFPAGMTCLWEISIRSPLRDILETSQKHLKRDVFFVTSLKRLKYISKKISFCDVFKTSEIHLKKDVFCVTSLRRLEHISKKMSFPLPLWDVSKTSLVVVKNFR